MEKEHYLEIAKEYFNDNFSDAECAFVAGSIMRGEGKAHSDIDLVVLYNENFNAVRRESHIYNGVPIEIFFHNEQAQDYFFDKDKKRGVCVMPSMVAEGEIIGKNNQAGLRRRKIAQNIIKQGPPALDISEINQARYIISDLSDDLKDPRSSGEIMGCLSKLYLDLGDFYLRAQRQWSGSGKGLIRALRQTDFPFGQKYEDAFAAAFKGDLNGLLILIEEV